MVFAVIFVGIFLVHLPVLGLPYFWDEAGYYVPVARDLLLTGSPIPHSTVSNAHPPLVMAWLALWWKLFGYAPLVTRGAMLMIAAFSLLGVFRLAQRVANFQVAIAATLCTAVYPVFFAQSSLALVDLAAAGLTFWALAEYVEGRIFPASAWFAVATLAKETAIIAPFALAIWEVAGIFLEPGASGRSVARFKIRNAATLVLMTVVPLACWYAFHFSRTGYVFGNPEFFHYNVAGTMTPLRFIIALIMRLWQVTGYLHLWLLTLGTLLAMWLLPPLRAGQGERPRIAIPVQAAFYVVIAAYVLIMSLIGGAVLARYMLPAVPLVIILCVSTFWRRMKLWRPAIALIVLAFVAGWFWNPQYGFAPEDNLAYRDYIVLHEEAELFLEARYPMARVLTAWPASDEISRSWLGYVTRPMRVVPVENFSSAELAKATQHSLSFDVALVFSTKYEPRPAIWDEWSIWTDLKSRYFGFHRDLPPEAAGQVLAGRVAFSERRQGQWIAVIEKDGD